MVRISYLGPAGTFSEEAARSYFNGSQTEFIAYPTIAAAVEAVRHHRVDAAVVPIENSCEGSVTATMDLLTLPGLSITAEVVHPICHHLLVKPGTTLEEIEAVVSHPQALAQCQGYLNRTLPGLVLQETGSTAEAARIVAGSPRRLAAIGNSRAAELNGLEALGTGIQDLEENLTRFIVLGSEAAIPTGQDKTSLIVSITNRPGGLYEILKEFALRNIDLTRIESRPAKSTLGEYLFYIDLRGHRDEPVVSECLTAVTAQAARMVVLGSYPEANQLTKSGQGTGNGFNLRQLREEIDILDYQIIELLGKRAEIVTLIGQQKQNRTQLRDYHREREVLQRLRGVATNKGLDPDFIEQIYQVFFTYYTSRQEAQRLV